MFIASLPNTRDSWRQDYTSEFVVLLSGTNAFHKLLECKMQRELFLRRVLGWIRKGGKLTEKGKRWPVGKVNSPYLCVHVQLANWSNTVHSGHLWHCVCGKLTHWGTVRSYTSVTDIRMDRWYWGLQTELFSVGLGCIPVTVCSIPGMKWSSLRLWKCFNVQHIAFGFKWAGEETHQDMFGEEAHS